MGGVLDGVSVLDLSWVSRPHDHDAARGPTASTVTKIDPRRRSVSHHSVTMYAAGQASAVLDLRSPRTREFLSLARHGMFGGELFARGHGPARNRFGSWRHSIPA